jgi:hypothetical protein
MYKLVYKLNYINCFYVSVIPDYEATTESFDKLKTKFNPEYIEGLS